MDFMAICIPPLINTRYVLYCWNATCLHPPFQLVSTTIILVRACNSACSSASKGRATSSKSWLGEGQKQTVPHGCDASYTMCWAQLIFHLHSVSMCLSEIDRVQLQSAWICKCVLWKKNFPCLLPKERYGTSILFMSRHQLTSRVLGAVRLLFLIQ